VYECEVMSNGLVNGYLGEVDSLYLYMNKRVSVMWYICLQVCMYVCVCVYLSRDKACPR
jgi:hypothetical protein